MSSGRPLELGYHDSLISVKFTLYSAQRNFTPHNLLDWERVWDRHNLRYPQKDRTAESLRRKFQTLVKKKMKTGDPNCPPHIRSAKRIYRKIVEATDGSDGESN